MASRLVIYSDESSKKGKHFSNFYGASVLRSEDQPLVESNLRGFIQENGLTCEIKWNNISPDTASRFCGFADRFFDEIEAERLKFRLMFTHNVWRPIGLTQEHIRHQYFILYYLFLKKGIGLEYYRKEFGDRELQLICDQFPHTGAQVAEFRNFLLGLNRLILNRNGLELRPELIGEAKSHNHVILQGTDLVLGAMQFKLNGFDKVKPEGKIHRGKKTRAKEAVYRHILKRIWKIYPNLNIGISTGTQGNIQNRWRHPYRHWKLIPSQREYDETAEK